MRKTSACTIRPAVGAPPDSPALGSIGQALRAHYDHLLAEPLPARLAALLARLEAGENGPAAAAPPPPEAE